VSGRFGKFGGQYVPETLMPALEELDAAYAAARADPAFEAELHELARDYAGRGSSPRPVRGSTASRPPPSARVLD
jgi:tryptophan synthase beta chain